MDARISQRFGPGEHRVLKNKKKIGADEVEQWLTQCAERLKTDLDASGIDTPRMIGVHTGGVWVARWLHKHLRLDTPLGELNIAFYRDDFSRIGVHPTVTPSKLPFEVENQHVVLVDDILYTGRTVRAAMNEIFDYGRPASVKLVALVERPGRELPVQADISGAVMSLSDDEHVKLSGPEPLELLIQHRPPGNS